MCEGYQPTGDDDHSGLDDEFLCEYVDGTMDPVVRVAFEEYLQANPQVAEHVRRLRNTRQLLCQYGCRCTAPQGLQARLRRELACEMVRAQMPLFPAVTSNLRSAAAFTSAMVVMLVVGMMAGATTLSEADDNGRRIAGALALPEVHQAAVPALPGSTPSYAYPQYSAFGAVLPGRLFAAPRVLQGADTLAAAFPLRRSGVAP